jgi:excisionase family DNA binding protein
MQKAKQNDDAPVPRIALTPEEAAVATGVARTRIFEAIRSGSLTCRMDGKARLIEVDELRRWLKAMPYRGRDPEADVAA